MNTTTLKTEFTGSQGETLAAQLELPEGPPQAFALFAHCFSCSKDIKAARDIARGLAHSGIAVLRFDFTGLGSSGGDFANTNFSSNVQDLIKAADYLRAEYQAPSLLVGHSLGGAAVIVAASEIPEVKGVATIGAPADAAHVTHLFGDKRAEIDEKGLAEVQLAGRAFTIKKQFIDDVSASRVTEALAVLKRPMLIMHAPLDDTVSIDNATQLFLAARHPKSFVSLDTADHLLTKGADASYVAKVLAAWAERFVTTPDRRVTTSSAISGFAPFQGGAVAMSVPGQALAVNLSIDGHPFVIDGSAAEGGSDLGPNPTRTVEGALAACAVMTMQMYARRKKWDLKSARAEVVRAPGEDDHRARKLVKTIYLEGDLDAAQRERLQEIADKCPVHRMLSEPMTIESSIG